MSPGGTDRWARQEFGAGSEDPGTGLVSMCERDVPWSDTGLRLYTGPIRASRVSHRSPGSKEEAQEKAKGSSSLSGHLTQRAEQALLRPCTDLLLDPCSLPLL